MQGAMMHLLVAFVWVFLIGNLSLGGLVGGLVAGYLLLAIFRRALNCENYVRRTKAFAGYAIFFVKEIVLSNVRIAMVALSKDPTSHKGRFIAYNVQNMTTLEIIILSHCLNLTPGTIVAKRSYDKCEIVVHTFAIGEPDAVRIGIGKMKDRILRFTR